MVLDGRRSRGFNQIKNTPFAAEVLAIVSTSGKHLPTSLVFGPRNGPEDFSKFGYRTFRRKLFKTWFLFVDDVCVATGKALNNEAVPGTELQRWLSQQPTAEERKSLEGLGKEFPADPSPFAHVYMPWTSHTDPVRMIPLRSLKFGTMKDGDPWNLR
jgi:hypothetical protein